MSLTCRPGGAWPEALLLRDSLPRTAPVCYAARRCTMTTAVRIRPPAGDHSPPSAPPPAAAHGDAARIARPREPARQERHRLPAPQPGRVPRPPAAVPRPPAARPRLPRRRAPLTGATGPGAEVVRAR